MAEKIQDHAPFRGQNLLTCVCDFLGCYLGLKDLEAEGAYRNWRTKLHLTNKIALHSM